ncbi:erythromycin resistance leader peptide [Staphylococcus aureus]|nr:erythromycin resistance leader peptide [Staphylococcus aureus]
MGIFSIFVISTVHYQPNVNSGLKMLFYGGLKMSFFSGLRLSYI